MEPKVCQFSRKNLRGDFWKKRLNFSLQQRYYNEKFRSFSRNLREDFYFKIGLISAKVYTKNTPNVEVCNFNPATPKTQSIKVVIVIRY